METKNIFFYLLDFLHVKYVVMVDLHFFKKTFIREIY